uniref:Putative secreted protein n=1 Tax=Ixodes ricinus TaxID=34613 RepID=A0A147BN01_IXORI
MMTCLARSVTMHFLMMAALCLAPNANANITWGIARAYLLRFLSLRTTALRGHGSAATAKSRAVKKGNKKMSMTL